jgi:hypothetical protein
MTHRTHFEEAARLNGQWVREHHETVEHTQCDPVNAGLEREASPQRSGDSVAIISSCRFSKMPSHFRFRG